MREYGERFDYNCLIGHWPFRKIRKRSIEDLRELHKAYQITGGYVGSMDSIFYNDPMEGDRELRKVLDRVPEYQLAQTINPMLSAFLEDLEQGIRQLNTKAVRIYPAYHGYTLRHPALLSLGRMLADAGLPLLVSCRLEDARLAYICHTRPVNVEDIKFLTEEVPRLKVILLCAYMQELLPMASSICGSRNVLFDTSGLRSGSFVLEKMMEYFPPDKIVFGSQWPLFCFSSSYLKVSRSTCDATVKENILSYK